jgi:hypothetical protein
MTEAIKAVREANGMTIASLYGTLHSILTFMAGEVSYGLIFAHLNRIKTLTRRGHFTLMDSTHKTNWLRWLLYTLIVRDK